MTTLDDILTSAHRARLIPTVATTRKEERLVSVLLAAMSVVRPLAESILTQCGTRMGKRATLETYTEVTFPTADGNENRPDGVLRLATGRSTWTALVEAKVDKAELDQEQLERYARSAREFGVDAILTLSNQLVALPTHLPYAIPKRLARHVECFHISWVSILTEASILLRDKEAMDPEQLWTLREVVRYVEHPSSTRTWNSPLRNSPPIPVRSSRLRPGSAGRPTAAIGAGRASTTASSSTPAARVHTSNSPSARTSCSPASEVLERTRLLGRARRSRPADAPSPTLVHRPGALARQNDSPPCPRGPRQPAGPARVPAHHGSLQTRPPLRHELRRDPMNRTLRSCVDEGDGHNAHHRHVRQRTGGTFRGVG